MMTVPFKCGNWIVDETNVLRGPLRNVRLAPAKTSLLKMLTKRINTVVSKDQLMNVTKNDDSLKVVICRLRTDLRTVGADSEICVSPGEGYLIRSESEVAIRPSFTAEQWKTLRYAVEVAERHEPGIAARVGLSPS
jgi:DNA-binding winged helix-turn-helix (wHTH) protein